MDMTYSLAPNTPHYEEKFENSQNNYENKYKLLDEDIGKTRNSVFDKDNKQNIESDQCVPDDNLNEDWAAVTLYTMTDKEYMETIAKLTQEQRNIYLLVENHINANQEYKQSLTNAPPNPLFLFWGWRYREIISYQSHARFSIQKNKEKIHLAYGTNRLCSLQY